MMLAPTIRAHVMSKGSKECCAEARAMMMNAVQMVTVTTAAHKPLRGELPLSS
jgi:hypothetical protein